MRCVLIPALVLLALGCRGNPDDIPDETAVTGPVPAEAPLRRLSTQDYRRGLVVLFGEAPVDEIQPLLAGVPEDVAEEEGEFSRNDSRLSQRHIDQYYAISDALAAQTAASPALRARFSASCETVDDACLDDFIPAFLRAALRRPATTEEVSAARTVQSEFEGADRVHAVVFTTLMKPEALYHFETSGSEANGVVTLTADELANRLSFHFWGEPPDEALRAAAGDGSLLTDEGLKTQVERLFADERTDATLDAFFDEWLHLSRGSYSASPRLSELARDIPLDGLAEEMQDEVFDLLHNAVRSPETTWFDVQTTEESFARTERLANLYGVTPWDGVGERPLFPAGERVGLLTRAALLSSGDGSTNPFRRGAYVKRLILCEFQAAPPADLPPDALTPPPVEPGASTRQSFAAKITDTQCAGCHIGFTPLGYALESYDGLGRFRTTERLVSDTGEDLGTAPIDDDAVVRLAGESQEVSDGADLALKIAQSGSADACLSRQYFRYAHRRVERAADQPLLDAWTAALDEGRPLGGWLKQVALDPTFRQRTLGGE
ncbi:MAG: DUF1592 domain-containing protein [Myxococcota bacterium]